jgi:CubicO group peptidase (beta-lactamase class C family)
MIGHWTIPRPSAWAIELAAFSRVLSCGLAAAAGLFWFRPDDQFSQPDKMQSRFCFILAFDFLVIGVAVGATAHAQDQQTKSTAATLAKRVADEVQAAIAAGKLPGCVVLAGSRGRVILREAYGRRRVEPRSESMTVDTVFDLASLTKPIATATSAMILAERGKLRLDDPVARYLPQFAAHGKDGVRVEHLLLHTAGLIADNPLADYDDGREQAIERVLSLKPVAPPGVRFIYSDVCFIVLGLLVEHTSGQPLDRFASENIFAPLGMHDTSFLPDERLRSRAAPADKRGDKWLVGEVHDPRAARLGGVAGHAGVFSTADDLAKYARAMLDQGRYGDRRLLGDETWRRMTRPQELPAGGRRALGWDIKSGFSTNRGKRLSDAAFGHGGFTGTSIWIDPANDLFVIFLSNRLHPDGKGSVNQLAGRIAEIVVESRPATIDVAR